jgi:hypothetical protein
VIGCSVDGCVRPLYTRGLCEAHYRRLLRTGSVNPTVPVGERPANDCAAEGCSRRATERGLCHGHYLRIVRTGELQPDRPLSRRVNTTCSVQGCDRPAELRQLCRPHANRKHKFGDVRADQPIREVGGGTISHGYRTVRVPAELRHLTNGEQRTAEHRLVMALMLGRPLFSDESVHHRNGDRLDNSPGNLELWSRWQPSGQRTGDKIAHALDVLRRYAPELLAADAEATQR